MTSKNALEILKKRRKKNPKLQNLYLEEKKKYRIACRIRECRMQVGISQAQLAERIGTTQSVIARLENADYTGHSFTILKKISSALGTPIESFVGESHERSLALIRHIPRTICQIGNFYPKQIQIIERRNVR